MRDELCQQSTVVVLNTVKAMCGDLKGIRNGYDPSKEPCGFQQYPHGESCSSVNSESLSAEYPNIGQVSGFVAEYSEEMGMAPEEICGFEQYPHGETDGAASSGSVSVENPYEGHFSSQISNSCELEAKRKENSCLSSNECCNEDFDVKKKMKTTQTLQSKCRSSRNNFLFANRSSVGIPSDQKMGRSAMYSSSDGSHCILYTAGSCSITQDFTGT